MIWFQNKKSLAIVVFLVFANLIFAQKKSTTFPYNGVEDIRSGAYAFTNATIRTNADVQLSNATLLIKDGKIVNVGTSITVPAEYKTFDLENKYIYPSFVELVSTYGMEKPPKPKWSGRYNPQYISNKKGAYGWNEAIKPEINAVELFTKNNSDAESLRKNGFGAIVTHHNDGIMRGSGTFVSLNTNKMDNEIIIADKVASFSSFSKGSSKQDYPGSLMGAIALLRQTHYDAKWYQTKGKNEEYNLSLAAINDLKKLPSIFVLNDRLSVLRADKICDEFNYQYIFKTGNDTYQRLDEIKATNGKLIVPLNYPEKFDVSDPYEAQYLTYAELKHWEMAPYNAKFIDDANIPFCFTSEDLESKGDFLKNIKIAIEKGLSEKAALRAITESPAKFINQFGKVGSLEIGKIANFLITTDSLFADDMKILENWVQGERFVIKQQKEYDLNGLYSLNINNSIYTLEVSGKAVAPKFKIVEGDSTIADIKSDLSGKNINLNFSIEEIGTTRLSGYIEGKNMKGSGKLGDGTWVVWTGTRVGDLPEKKEDKTEEKIETATEDLKEEVEQTATYVPSIDDVVFPFVGYGNSKNEIEKNNSYLIKNATIWTNEADGILFETDVLVSNGKISRIGKGLSAGNAKVIDGTGKHLTAGIIDEHSHIAISRGVNEWTQQSSAEVRIGDVINSEDVNIYRQLAGGVTMSQLLHGSANPIGGQSAIIKLRWGQEPEKMKVENAVGFIKFALGENVKQSNWGDDNKTRFPQSRMGVEQVFVDHFTRAKNYNPIERVDLELEAIQEILNKKRFITCHSYVQSEITMLMRVAEDFDFNINTFTHILEGYKVADKMAEHGAMGSTFSDWWRYKYEVMDAIPYNGTIMTKAGVVSGFNSDDAEMARRLNQEAAKAVKYGNLDEQEALKLVTLNPAIMLHVDDRVGSIKVGKDADIVLWDNHPLSVYTKAEKTFVDGIMYFDRAKDAIKFEQLEAEKNRIIQLMLEDANNGGGKGKKPMKKSYHLYHCDDIEDEGRLHNEHHEHSNHNHNHHNH